MQEETIAEGAINPNLVLLRATGSGKTLRFSCLPVHPDLRPGKEEVQALIIRAFTGNWRSKSSRCFAASN